MPTLVSVDEIPRPNQRTLATWVKLCHAAIELSHANGGDWVVLDQQIAYNNFRMKRQIVAEIGDVGAVYFGAADPDSKRRAGNDHIYVSSDSNRRNELP